ncbi:thioredoxin domain-containing protein [Prochlorococcus marinus]|uniref:Thioredoxin n=1 Tax=Prochlorococcus marinus XMU1408 TaxID=2213228 RepID=A0A318R0A0_PROMR|nr:thioredoxin domain-containing protein [Prochlorococcus marinus]MBW3041300.1 thioredoxin [Prochlorococcus marinus str. XMU1408]PYE02475.1 thioredoxin [Prochlorococcus marinus XMU1408]
MNDTTNTDKELSFLEKCFLVFLSIILVISLFFFRSGFRANAILDELAKNSLLPEVALSNGRPTVFEFYADWCEACKEMAPAMIDAKKQNPNKLDVVLLNVDNPRWVDWIDKYDVNGIPKLIFFDDKGELKGVSLGVRKFSELNEIFFALINNSELPSFSKLSNSSNLTSETYLEQRNVNKILNSVNPRDHN